MQLMLISRMTLKNYRESTKCSCATETVTHKILLQTTHKTLAMMLHLVIQTKLG